MTWAQRTPASAPAVAHELADALAESADAQARHDQAVVSSASALALQLAAERQRLEAGNARYEQWAADRPGQARNSRESRGRTPAARTAAA